MSSKLSTQQAVKKQTKRGSARTMPFEVVRFEDQPPTYEEFLRKVLLPNNACLISPQLIQNWPIYQWLHSAQDYAQADGGLHPAFELLAAQFGDHQVPVVVSDLQSDHDARNANSAGRYEDVSSSRAEMSLRDAISLMKQQAAFRNGPTGPHKLVYVKDWHLVREERLSTRVALNKWYGTPDIFQDDWMNNDRLPDVNSNRKQTSPTSPPDDFRFCYAGMKDTTTGLHQDVYGSYSWSTNIVGSKEWRLYDPRNAKLLLDYIESHQPDEDTFSQLNYETIEQPPGWTIFVPSNCFHTVRNREDTISINQNWCNSICLERMYNGLKVDMCKTADALHDVRDMMRSQDDTSWKVEFWRTVQLVNRSNTGWDWTTFWKMCVSWLEKPSCPPEMHPSDADFVHPLISRLVDDFIGLDYYPLIKGDSDVDVASLIQRAREICTNVAVNG